jgi:hypothetical protein
MMELVYDVTDRVPEHLGRNFHLALELRVKARYRPRAKRVPEHLGRNFHLALELRVKARYRPRAKLDVKDAEFIVKLTQEFNLFAKEELEG